MRHGPATEDFSAVYEYVATNRYSTERAKLLGDFGRAKSAKSPRMTNIHPTIALGAPGVEPRWTRSTKEGLGTAYHTSCTLWFTLSHGIARDGEVFGKIHPAHERYAEQRAVSRHEMWTFRHQTRRIPRGKTLRLL
jgi:glucodextranase-like protein